MTRDGLVYYLIFKWWLRLSDLIWQFLFHDEKNILSIKFKIGTGTGIGIVFFFINNAAKPVVCEVWHMRRTFAWPQNFHKQVVPPLLLKCLYKSREVRGHFFVLDVSILPVSTNFGLSFVTVLTVWYFTSYCYKQ